MIKDKVNHHTLVKRGSRKKRPHKIFISKSVKITMAKALKKIDVPEEEIISKIYFIRNRKIMLDKNLA